MNNHDTATIPELLQNAHRSVDAREWDEARSWCNAIINKDPCHAEALHLLGIIAFSNQDLARAIEMFGKAATLQPANKQLLFNYGAALLEIGRYSDALKIFNTVLSLAPDHVPTINTCSAILGKMGFITLSERLSHYAMQQEPSNPDAHLNLANSLREQGAIDEALQWFQKTLALNPEDDLVNAGYLLCLNYSLKKQQTIFDAHRQWGRNREHSISARKTRLHSSPANSTVRIGYVSEDFRTHSVGYFIEPVIACHDKKDFGICCYSGSSTFDETTARIKNHATTWRSIYGLNDETVYSMIQEDGIDILVDCAGHTGHNRLSLFCMRPAPIQVTYLGYPNTTGLTRIDYRLTDHWADPEGQDIYHTEKLIRLPRGFLCYQPPQPLAEIAPSPFSLHNGITFGSFNNLPKINAPVIKAWASILRQVRQSRLLIKTKQFNDQKVIDRYSQLFREQGIHQDRLEFHGYSRSREDHLALYNHIDIALDTFPYNGTTTTCEALCMGVPVISLAGDRHAGRVGVSILSQTGLTRYLAGSEEEYVGKSVACAHEIAGGRAHREQLRETVLLSGLCDRKIFTKILEAAYREMMTKI